MVLIRIFVNPNVTIPPTQGEQIIGNVRLKPGENWVESEHWDKVKNLKLVRQKLATGLLIDVGSGGYVPPSQPQYLQPQPPQLPQAQYEQQQPPLQPVVIPPAQQQPYYPVVDNIAGSAQFQQQQAQQQYPLQQPQSQQPQQYYPPVQPPVQPLQPVQAQEQQQQQPQYLQQPLSSPVQQPQYQEPQVQPPQDLREVQPVQQIEPVATTTRKKKDAPASSPTPTNAEPLVASV